MARRREPTDAEWLLAAPHLPARPRLRAGADHRRTISGVLLRASAGLRWPDPPDRFGAWRAAYERPHRRRDAGTWAALLHDLQRSADRAGLIDRGPPCVGSTPVRASRPTAHQAGPGRVRCRAATGRRLRS